MMMAFSGNDGAGKSTMAYSLYNLLRLCGVNVEYHEEFKHFILQYVSKIMKKRVEYERRILKRIPYRKGSSLKYRLWAIAVLIDSMLEREFSRIFRKEGLTILDRCIIDHLASFEYIGCLTNLTRKLFINAPRPDLVIVLDAPPKLMYERKKNTHNFPYRFYVIQQKRYYELAKYLSLPLINTSKPINETLEEVVHILVKNISKRQENLVLHVLSDPLGKSDFKLIDEVDFRKLDYMYLLVEASRNNVELQFFKKLLNYDIPSKWSRILEEIISTLIQNNSKIVNKLIDVVELLEKNGINYCIFKTFPIFESVPRDIDIIVDNYKDAIKLLKNKGYVITKSHIRQKEVSLMKEGVEFDVHWDIGWNGESVVDIRELFKNVTITEIDGYPINVPNSNYELLLVMAHAVLQHHYLTLGELHYIRSIIYYNNIYWRKIFHHALEQDWMHGLMKALGIIKLKDLFYYSSELFDRIPVVKNLGINIMEIEDPVSWITHFNYKPLKSVKDFIKSSSTAYRYYRWRITRKLPFNEPSPHVLRLLSKYR